MSSLVKQQGQLNEDVYLNFVNSIKSDVTKKTYEYNLRLFMEFCGIDKFEDLIGRQNQIITYLMSLREKKLSYNSISTRLNAIYHFYDMNDVSLNKKKIKMFKGEYTRKVVDRAYTHEEISKMLDVSDLRTKTIVLLMASSGIRIGSLPDIRIRNLEKVNNIYKVTVYEGSNSQYFTFCTPECTSYIDAYLDFRTKNGENRQSFGPNTKIRPVNFSTEHKNMFSNLHAIISKGYLAIEEKHDKLLTSLRTAYAKELTLDKEQTSYDDLLDALRLSLNGYNIK
jgi:site-specific recombinase XerC